VKEAASSGKKRWFLRVLKLLIVVLVVGALGRTLLEAWGQLQRGEYEWDLRPGWLVAAGCLYITGLLPGAFFWRHVLLALGQEVRLGETLRAYFVGHLGKHSPGKTMVTVMIRVRLIRSDRVDTRVAAASVFFQTFIMMAVGAFIAAAVLAILCPDQEVLVLTAVGLMALAALPTVPPIFRRLAWLASRGRLGRSGGSELDRLGYRTMLTGWIAMSIGWVLLGLSLWAVVRAIGVQDVHPLGQLPLYVGSVSLSVVAGVLSLVPGGAGVRELILTELMIPHFRSTNPQIAAEAAALGSAVLLRVVWLVSELIVAGIVLLPAFGRRET
jgi:uncharacterized membrane protein YbhN (UPF0104 family)